MMAVSIRSNGQPFSAIFVIVCMGVTATACDSRTPVSFAPMAPTPPTSVLPPTIGPRNVDLSNFTGDANVVSRSGNGGCGWGTSIGEVRKGVLWRVSTDGPSVVLDEDMSNAPTDDVLFRGMLTGREFTASYFQGEDYARYVCQFREAHLSGQFSSDLSTFEALETLVWGVPGNETVVHRRWSARRLESR